MGGSSKLKAEAGDNHLLGTPVDAEGASAQVGGPGDGAANEVAPVSGYFPGSVRVDAIYTKGSTSMRASGALVRTIDPKVPRAEGRRNTISQLREEEIGPKGLVGRRVDTGIDFCFSCFCVRASL